MYLAVKSVKALEEYKLLLTFENNEQKIFEKGVFQELKNENLFKTVKVSFDSIEWSNGVDIDPEVLYEDGLSLI